MKIRFTWIGGMPKSLKHPRRVERLARAAALRVLARHRVEGRGALNVVWTSKARVRALNRQFRATDRFTDVIAFRYDAHARGPFDLPRHAADPFGDLYIAWPQARDNAKIFHVSFEEELVRLVAHGTLHLLGYTDYTPRAKKKMWAVQESILRRVLSKR